MCGNDNEADFSSPMIPAKVKFLLLEVLKKRLKIPPRTAYNRHLQCGSEPNCTDFQTWTCTGNTEGGGGRTWEMQILRSRDLGVMLRQSVFTKPREIFMLLLRDTHWITRNRWSLRCIFTENIVSLVSSGIKKYEITNHERSLATLTHSSFIDKIAKPPLSF